MNKFIITWIKQCVNIHQAAVHLTLSNARVVECHSANNAKDPSKLETQLPQETVPNVEIAKAIIDSAIHNKREEQKKENLKWSLSHLFETDLLIRKTNQDNYYSKEDMFEFMKDYWSKSSSIIVISINDNI